MTPFPWHSFELRTRLSPQQARTALAACMEEERLIRFTWWPSEKNDRRFSGRLYDDGFYIYRIMGYRNSFAPHSRGKIEADGRGARITISMQMHAAVLVLVTAIGLVLGAALVASTPWYLALLGIAFIYGMVWFGFWLEAGRQEETLRSIFQAT